jgi:transcriptional regulator with XRE-family HTH domain
MAMPAKYPRAGRMIREARQAAGLTQRQVADDLRVSPVTVSRWDRGKLRPNRELLRKAAELYEVAYEPLADAYWPHETRPSSGDDDLRERVTRLEANYANSDRLQGKLARLPERDRRAVEALVDELLSA